MFSSTVKGLVDSVRASDSKLQQDSEGATAGAAQGANFFLMVTGQVEYGEFENADNVYCRYALSYGNDWNVVHGPESGLSQIAKASESGADTGVVWNFPIDISFKSTNPFGWPRLALSVFGVDMMGRDVVVGYGSVLIPTIPGRHERWVHMYTPKASSLIQQFRSWIAGAYPEFFDSKFVTRSEGREMTRVERTGAIRVSLNVMTRGMGQLGYSCGDMPAIRQTQTPAPSSSAAIPASLNSMFGASQSRKLSKAPAGTGSSLI